MARKLCIAQIALCALLFIAGCTQQMANQARCEPYERTEAFADGRCNQLLPPNTVPRSTVAEFFAGDQALVTDRQPVRDEITGLPFEVTRDLLAVGQDRYVTFCAPCHGLAGYGDGMIVQRGFRAPPSFHSERLRQVPPEYIVQVITEGFGIMYSYAYRVPEDERWAIAAYIQALQLSQNAPVEAQSDPPAAPKRWRRDQAR
ncbi:MAG: cytochrome c [Oscillochloris sp.]|nr:cytochrome c [Oscillochloris sp.]